MNAVLQLPCLALGNERTLNVAGHKAGNILPVVGGLPHDGGGKITPLDGCGQEHRLDLGHHSEVRVGQLNFIFKIRDRTQAAHHDGSALLLGEGDRQPVEGVDLDIRDVLAGLPQHGNALLYRKKRGLGAVDQHRDDHLVKHTAGALDNIEMPVRDGVEAAGIHGDGGHGW